MVTTPSLKPLENALLYEATDRFQALLDSPSITADDKKQALFDIVTTPHLERDGKLKEARDYFLEKVALLFSQIQEQHPSDAKRTIIATAATADTAAYRAMLDKVKNTEIFGQALLEASGKTQDISEYAALNVESLLRAHKIADEWVYKALDTAAVNGLPDQTELLASHLKKRFRDDPLEDRLSQRGLHVINHTDEEGKTLFQRAIEAMQESRFPKPRIIEALIDLGATPPVSVRDQDMVESHGKIGYEISVIEWLKEMVSDHHVSRAEELLRLPHQEFNTWATRTEVKPEEPLSWEERVQRFAQRDFHARKSPGARDEAVYSPPPAPAFETQPLPPSPPEADTSISETPENDTSWRKELPPGPDKSAPAPDSSLNLMRKKGNKPPPPDWLGK